MYRHIVAWHNGSFVPVTHRTRPLQPPCSPRAASCTATSGFQHGAAKLHPPPPRKPMIGGHPGRGPTSPERARAVYSLDSRRGVWLVRMSTPLVETGQVINPRQISVTVGRSEGAQIRKSCDRPAAELGSEVGKTGIGIFFPGQKLPMGPKLGLFLGVRNSAACRKYEGLE